MARRPPYDQRVADQPTPSDQRALTDAELIARADSGDRAAAAELDRRGVEVPLLEPEHDGPLPLLV
jgi:hypothetical protein